MEHDIIIRKSLFVILFLIYIRQISLYDAYYLSLHGWSNEYVVVNVTVQS